MPQQAEITVAIEDSVLAGIDIERIEKELAIKKQQLGLLDSNDVITPVKGLDTPRSLEPLLAESRNLGFHMSSDNEVGALLRTLATTKPGGKFLELGTGTGMGTAWILEGMDSKASLVSVESNAEFLSCAEHVLGSDPRISFLNEDAESYLERNQDSRFDFIFADSIPGKYIGLDLALNILNVGGIYIVDDMQPPIELPQPFKKAIEDFIGILSAHRGLRVARMPFASGILVAVKEY